MDYLRAEGRLLTNVTLLQFGIANAQRAAKIIWKRGKRLPLPAYRIAANRHDHQQAQNAGDGGRV